MDRRLAVTIGIVQFFFAVTWTVYVVYLPQLVEQAGIARSWVPWILVADQLIFALVDVATGFWVDRVRRSIALLGPWILAVTVLSGLAFIALPFMPRFATAAELTWLMPVFWIGFNLGMLPASRGVQRIGTLPLMALAGACWGVASVAAYTAAVGFGRTGREGRFLGTLFAVLAVATLSRIAVNPSGLGGLPEFKSLLPWLPAASWLAAGLLLMAASGRRSKH